MATLKMKEKLACLLFVSISISIAEEEELNLLEFFTGEEEERYTGFTCGTTEYSDWPCMEADGCIVKEKSYENFIDN